MDRGSDPRRTQHVDAFSICTALPIYAGGVYPKYSRIDVGNAVAAIEGTYRSELPSRHGTFDVIDGNQNGLITAQEIQTFVDNSAAMGMPEAGAIGAASSAERSDLRPSDSSPPLAGESPDQPDVLQRRYNLFDYAADGQLDGVVSIQQYRMLAKNLLPSPDAFVIIDRQRSSANGYLIDPSKDATSDLQYIKPKYAFIPKAVLKKYTTASPASFGVGSGTALG